MEALFKNENVSNIFSEAGINSIFSLDNWYEYSCVYVIIVINIAMIGTFVVGIKLDKAVALGTATTAAISTALVGDT